MNTRLKQVLALGAVLLATQAVAQVTFFEREGFDGRSFTTQRQIANLERFGFNDRAYSATVAGARWEVCEDTRFDWRCVGLRPGRYPSLLAMGLQGRLSAVGARSPDMDAKVLSVCSRVTSGSPPFGCHVGVASFHARSPRAGRPVAGGPTIAPPALPVPLRGPHVR